MYRVRLCMVICGGNACYWVIVDLEWTHLLDNDGD